MVSLLLTGTRAGREVPVRIYPLMQVSEILVVMHELILDVARLQNTDRKTFVHVPADEGSREC